MLIFNCTKAASDFFTVKRKGEKLTPIVPTPSGNISDTETLDGPNSSWLVHAIPLKRKHVLIATQINTRYTMVFSALKKGDPNEFTRLFFDRLLAGMTFYNDKFELRDENTSQKTRDRFIKYHQGNTIFCKRGDLSTQTTINQVSWHFDDQVHDMGYFPNNREEAALFDGWANSMLRRSKQKSDYFFPNEDMFLEWVRCYGKLTQEVHSKIRDNFKALRSREFFSLGDNENVSIDNIEHAVDGRRALLHKKQELPDNVIDLFSARQKRMKNEE